MPVRQTDDVQPPPPHPTPTLRPTAVGEWAPALHPVTSTSTTTVLRILRHLAKEAQIARDRTTAVTRLMAFIPTAVTVGYLREPDMELPVPGHDFADHVKAVLASASGGPDADGTAASRTDQDLHNLFPQAPPR